MCITSFKLNNNPEVGNPAPIFKKKKVVTSRSIIRDNNKENFKSRKKGESKHRFFLWRLNSSHFLWVPQHITASEQTYFPGHSSEFKPLELPSSSCFNDAGTLFKRLWSLKHRRQGKKILMYTEKQFFKLLTQNIGVKLSENSGILSISFHNNVRFTVLVHLCVCMRTYTHTQEKE